MARDQTKLGNREKPGDVMRYASLNTTVQNATHRRTRSPRRNRTQMVHFSPT